MTTTSTGPRWQTLQFAPFWQLNLQAAGEDGRPTDGQIDTLTQVINGAKDAEAGLWRDLLESIGSDQDKVLDAFYEDEREVTAGLKEAAGIVIIDHSGDQRAKYGIGMSKLAFALVRAATGAPWPSVDDEIKKRLALGASVYVGLDLFAYSIAAMEHNALDDPILGVGGKVRKAIVESIGDAAQPALTASPTKPARFCSACGGRLTEGARFCAACGAGIS